MLHSTFLATSFTLLLFIITSYFAQAQAQAPENYNSDSIPEGKINIQQIHQSENRILIIESYEKSSLRTSLTPIITQASIMHYDSSKNLLKEVSIVDIDFKKNSICSLNGRYIKGQYHMFVEFFIKNKKRDIYFGILNPNTGKLIQSLQKIDSYDGIDLDQKWDSHNKLDVYQKIVVSKDTTKVLFIAAKDNTTGSNKKKIKSNLYFRCVDNQSGQLLWEKKLPNNHLPKSHQIYDIVLTNDGSTASLLLLDIEMKISNLKYIGKDIAVKFFTLSQNGKNISITDLPSKKGYELGDSKLLITSNGDLYCIGIYQIGEYNTNVTERGLYFTVINSEEQTLTDVKYKPFTGTIKDITDDNYICSSWNNYFTDDRFNIIHLSSVIEFQDGTIGILLDQMNNIGYISGQDNVYFYHVKYCRKNLFFSIIQNNDFKTSTVIPKEKGHKNETCFGSKSDTATKTIQDKIYLRVSTYIEEGSVIELFPSGQAKITDYQF